MESELICECGHDLDEHGVGLFYPSRPCLGPSCHCPEFAQDILHLDYAFVADSSWISGRGLLLTIAEPPNGFYPTPGMAITLFDPGGLLITTTIVGVEVFVHFSLECDRKPDLGLLVGGFVEKIDANGWLVGLHRE